MADFFLSFQLIILYGREIGMTNQPLHLLASFRLPQPGSAVLTPGQNEATIRREIDRSYRPAVAGELAHLLAGPGLPHPGGTVLTPRQHAAAIG